MARNWSFVGAVLGGVAVATGAFGAQYQLAHALALVAAGLVAERRPSKAIEAAGGSFTLGIVLFSGSLYALALTGVRALGAITPFGGVLLLAGWVALAVASRTPRTTA